MKHLTKNLINKVINKRLSTDVILLVAVNLVAFSILAYLDAFEWFYQYSRSHENWELDELLVLTFTLSITSAFFAFRRIREMKKLQQRLERYAQTDFLTGLYNRRKLHQVGKHALDRLERGELSAMSVLLLDLDNFKQLNDLYGHLIGDEVIKEVAQVLKSCVGKSDAVARWGGEEFLVVCPAKSEQEAMKLAELMRKSIERRTFNMDHPLSVSIGLSSWSKGMTFNDILHKADDALFMAKNQGKNQVRVLH
ncbi:GGDEF domain-containing protein [Alteromonas sediminis]|uniref:diguanylate cyclase n=1 Tax=Alteromonas sediminis TaxID=2259342 RepID=A0A3N5YEC7_9ALTE|nr:GGDEF domain-containing protein [Alteromonas sediminis]RPJ68045.1 GGDEF domain-containing protein [Alteromonas sediminis]